MGANQQLIMSYGENVKDIQADGFQGVVIVQTTVPDQIDIEADGFQGLVIVQTTYP